ncbi:hypothetical protein F2Q69_00015479 [Brassica cretica]|uniref:non-specific serine/threonine protein kinase n=1 Tax=Brassica cretica TaxID=69181 RepID=A0A8S9R6P0_BRACR|nr:hypothetical protein F2Q69_00015479 [Brassica cretica]
MLKIRHNSGEFPHLFRSQSSYAPTIPNPICSLCFCETLDVGGEEDLLVFNGRRGYKFTRELILLPLRWKTVNVRLSGEDGEIGDAQWRRIAYESASSFALLESRRNSISSLLKMDMCPSLYQTECYLEPLAVSLVKEKWSLVQLLMLSSYSGFGTSSLKQVKTRASIKTCALLGLLHCSPCGGHLPPSPVVDAKKSMSAAKLANPMMKRQDKQKMKNIRRQREGRRQRNKKVNKAWELKGGGAKAKSELCSDGDGGYDNHERRRDWWLNQRKQGPIPFVGTHEYLAPEIIRREGHGAAVDWWTFGVLLYELLYGKTPFKGYNNDETLANVLLQNLMFPDSPLVSFQAKDLIRGLLVKEPENWLGSERGSAEIKRHPFFEGLNWALIRCAIPPELPDFYELGGGPEAAGSAGGNDDRYLKCKAIGDHLEFELF